MRPVRTGDLAVVALGLGIAAWLLVRSSYGLLPPLQWWLAVPLGVLAVAEALGARTLRARLAAERELRRVRERPPPAALARPVRPVDPLLVARLVVLAQASAYVGAVFVGVWSGVLLYLAGQLGRLYSAPGDARAAVLGLVCAAGLVVAALRLESVCRVPPPEGDPPGS